MTHLTQTQMRRINSRNHESIEPGLASIPPMPESYQPTYKELNPMNPPHDDTFDNLADMPDEPEDINRGGWIEPDSIDHDMLTFGKYKGQTPDQVAKHDPHWLVWAFNNVTNKVTCTKLLADACEKAPKKFVQR